MKQLLTVFVVTVMLVGCSSSQLHRSGGKGPRTAQCTELGGWAGWTGGISTSGSRSFC